MNPDAQDAYLRNAVLTASPEQLQLMLYDGAIRFATQGREAILNQDIEGSYNLLQQAEAVVLEMQKGLNPEVAPKLCEQMSSLYSFVYRRLVDANVNKEVSAVDDALRILHYQRETWVMLMEKLKETSVEGHRPLIREASPTQPSDEATGAGLCLEG
jgi:flagellar protein FliS